MTDFKIKFGRRLKELRKSKNFSQEKFAELIEIAPRNLSKIETGQAFPSSSSLEKIISVLEVEANNLFEFEHHGNKNDLKAEINKYLSELSDERLKDIYKIIKALVN
ncbi:MAG: helix-turn-helix transcriptional regulator [bacterium]|nr:helix-turn-helix transcriptional regulator [bacterium]